MTSKKESIKEFFQGEKQYSIPVYQRAYSWEEQNWRAFFEDLQEATKGENHYFFGNVLLEESDDKRDGEKDIDIIDGQQRITTIVIFVRAMLNVLEKRAKKERLDKEIENEIFLEYIKDDYLSFRLKAKLKAVEYDRDYFENLIIKNETTHESQTPSQERIKKAKEFFEKALDKENTEVILKMFKAMQKAEILSIPFENKKDSVLMFELQNNRGKALTNMEKLKSYFAYQIYTYCSKEEAEQKLNEITNIFKEIYRIINDIKKIDEDSILNYFNISKSMFGFNYRENDEKLNYKKELKEQKDENKIAWIENYMKELKEAFVDFKEFQRNESIYKEYLSLLEVWEVYPFILKAYHLFREDKKQLEQVFHALEIIAFRDKLVKTRADFASRLNEVLKNFTKVEDLENGLKAICTEKKWYWRDDAVSNVLDNIYIDNDTIISYILMRYENYLRTKDTKTKGYFLSLKDLKTPEIEHIAPQTENGESLEVGYCEYDKEFFDDCYLHCIGNLLLIDKSHNSSLGNKPFKNKLASYENTPLAQQREIKDFVKDDKWDKDAISARHEKIEKFVFETWSFA